MNPEQQMTQHKAFYRLKEAMKLELWDLCIDEGISGYEGEGYDKLRDMLMNAMNESFKIGEGK